MLILLLLNVGTINGDIWDSDLAFMANEWSHSKKFGSNTLYVLMIKTVAW